MTRQLITLIYFKTVGPIPTLEKERDFLNVERENLKDSEVFKNLKKMLAYLSILDLLCRHRSKPGADYMHCNKHSGRYAQCFWDFIFFEKHPEHICKFRKHCINVCVETVRTSHFAFVHNINVLVLINSRI
jgi:hypothetical protein